MAEEEKIDVYPIETKFNEILDEEGFGERVSTLGVRGRRSLVVDFSELYERDIELAMLIVEDPERALFQMSECLKDKLRMRDPAYLDAQQSIGRAFYVRVRNLPQEFPLREIIGDQIGTIIQVDGIIVKATDAKPRLVEGVFRCTSCGAVMEVKQDSQTLKKPGPCVCKRSTFEILRKKCTYIPEQWITIQEKPEELPPGHVPKSFRVRLVDDLVNTINPGDRVKLVGIMDAIQERPTSLLFTPYIDSINIEQSVKDQAILEITEEDEKDIIELSKEPWLFRNMTKSICPSLYGLQYIKEAMVYLLFGGVMKQLPDVRIRGDIHVLLIGDPGTGKSQLLGYAAAVAPRGVLTTGRGSTAAGLTASCVKEKDGTFILEAGALVLADKGICCIDELDKMKEDDRGAIHPAMEQQIISVAKGGIIATLNSRTSILAAANPVLGRYNPYQTIGANMNLPYTLLNRFDLIFVIRDLPNLEKDTKIADHILRIHQTASVESPIDPKLLRKYIAYAKEINPRLTDEASARLNTFYVKMRSSSVEGGEASAISITARQLESIIRLAEARARVHLRDLVILEDVEAATALTTRSLEQVGIDMETGEIDIDILYSGKPRSMQMQLMKVLEVIGQLQRVEGIVQDEDLYTALVEDHGIARSEAARLVGVLMRDGTIYSPRPGYYKKTS